MDVKHTLSILLAKDTNVFLGLVEAIEQYYSRPVSTMLEMRARDNKKAKGDVWEAICKEWLIACGRYEAVYLLHEVPDAIRESHKVKRVDNGIDIVAKTKTGYVAVQCKYRKKGKVPWTTLSTFVGLCAVTGPWEKHVVITNCSGVTRRIPRGPKDASICLGTFKATKREVWLKMAGTYVEHKLTPPGVQASETLVEDKVESKPSVEELRALRLKHYT